MEIEFVGAAQTVTGSKHLIHTPHATILLDCGFFQGRRSEAREKNEELGFDPQKITAVVLSHAHIDHSGALPMLMKRGFRGSIYVTPATRDLAAVMLTDAAFIQASDARYINKTIEREGADMLPVVPLYEEEDVVDVLKHMVSVPYHRRQTIAPGVDLTFLDAGHVLGSAITCLDIDDVGQKKRIVFTGDLGRTNMPILRDPEIPSDTHCLITESTYGDRLHAPIQEMQDQLAALVTKVAKRGGKIIIPSFALERAQEVIFALKQLRVRGLLPPIPVYVDSPLTMKITEIFKMHPECYDSETRAFLERDAPFEFEDLKYTRDKDASIAIDAEKGPAIIISASGMCEAGRVVHHLKASIGDDRNMVIIVGFQAQHTLGRRIVERRPKVRIFGVERDLRAEVAVLSGFSAHADQADLLRFAEAAREKGPLAQVALVHGEPKSQAVFRAELEKRKFGSVVVPASGDRLTV